MKKRYCLKVLILLLTIFVAWKNFGSQILKRSKPLLAAAIPTDLTFLGEDGTFSVGAGEFLITREFDPFEWKTVPGPATANLEDRERAWSCVGECEDFFYGYHVRVDYGQIKAGETVWYIGMDDDIDHRINYFYLDEVLIHTIEQGLVFSGSFVIPHDGELSLMTNDSIQARIEVPDQTVTPTPTKVVTVIPTQPATPTPTKVPTGMPTLTPTSTPTSTPTITPSPTPTNTPPKNISFEPNSGDICHDLGGPIVEFMAKYNDTDFQSDLSKNHDIKTVKVRFGEETSPLVLVTQRNGDPGANLDDYGNSISLIESELSIKNTSYFDLLFSLDFSRLPASRFGNYNVYMFVEDWQGDTDGWDLMGNLSIWNCWDVLITGSVYDVSQSFPNTTCAQLNPADSPPRAAVNILFDCNQAGGINLNTDGSGRYSADLIHLDVCSYSLTLAEYFTDIADLSECGGFCQNGPFGWVTIDPVNPPYYQAEIDFGMSKANDPWIQVVGGDILSHGPISNLVPISCTNEYREGGECLPFIAINDPALGFLEEGITASKMSIFYGEGLTIGSPNDWQVVDTSLWQSVGKGFRYILSMVQNSLRLEEILSGNQSLSGITGLQDGFVGADESEIRFVDGNLTIDRDLEVENGGLAMLIVSGNVRINASVNRLEAIILADGSIFARDNPDRNEEQLVMTGSFAADIDGDKNGAFRNRRDLGIGRDGNSLSPAIVFKFRPDMILAILRDGRITESLYDWEELKP